MKRTSETNNYFKQNTTEGRPVGYFPGITKDMNSLDYPGMTPASGQSRNSKLGNLGYKSSTLTT